MKKIAKYPLTALLILFISACGTDTVDSDDGRDPGEPEIPEIPKIPEEPAYTLKSINFYISGEDTYKVIPVDKIALRIDNYTGTMQPKAASGEAPENYSSSMFSFGPEFYKTEITIPENIEIQVPYSVEGEEIKLTQDLWAVTAGQRTKRYPGSPNSPVDVSPHTSVSIVHTYEYRDLSLSFDAVCTSDDTGGELIVSGKWNGRHQVLKGIAIRSESLLP